MNPFHIIWSQPGRKYRLSKILEFSEILTTVETSEKREYSENLFLTHSNKIWNHFTPFGVNQDQNFDFSKFWILPKLLQVVRLVRNCEISENLFWCGCNMIWIHYTPFGVIPDQKLPIFRKFQWNWSKNVQVLRLVRNCEISE